MVIREVTFDSSKLSKSIADFTMGFLLLSRNEREEDAVSAGSGAFVRAGSAYGILTAAHVLKHLPEHGEVGIVRFPNVQPYVQKQVINMAHAEKLMIAANTFGPDGPDLGFLRLPPDTAASLRATSSFYNLEKRRSSITASEQASALFFDAIVGVVAERTTDLPPKLPSMRLKSFTALVGISKIIREHSSRGFDLFDLQMNPDPDFNIPSSYEGMSGGAWWRFYCEVNSEGTETVLDTQIHGVAFYQSAPSNGNRIITCHGPNSVYNNLIQLVACS